MCWRVGRPSLIVSVFCGYRRKLQAPSLPGFIRQREQQRRCRSQLHVCPFLRGQGRHDARLERHHPRRIRYAPMSKNRRGLWGLAWVRSTCPVCSESRAAAGRTLPAMAGAARRTWAAASRADLSPVGVRHLRCAEAVQHLAAGAALASGSAARGACPGGQTTRTTLPLGAGHDERAASRRQASPWSAPAARQRNFAASG